MDINDRANNLGNRKEEGILHPVRAGRAEKNSESVNIFAEGLPEWSIEPPQVMIRRRRHL